MRTQKRGLVMGRIQSRALGSECTQETGETGVGGKVLPLHHSPNWPPITQALLELTELLASHNNYARYRRTWASCTGFRLPVLGVHLKDLVSLHEAQPYRQSDGRLQLSKLNSLYLRLQELDALQRQRPPGSANQDLLHLLMVSLPDPVLAFRAQVGLWDQRASGALARCVALSKVTKPLDLSFLICKMGMIIGPSISGA